MTVSPSVDDVFMGALRRKVMAGVVLLAREGLLPAFAAHMGLPEHECDAMLRDIGLPPTGNASSGDVRAPAPPLVADLVCMMLSLRSPDADGRHATWLAHAVASASHGRRHLWQDLGLAGRTEVSALLRHYFQPLFERNRHDLKWKRFLYEELGGMLGRPGLRAPGCAHCEDFGRCFAAASGRAP